MVVGAGPNGLAAAIALAQAGRSVRVLEAAAQIGGGTRTEELTLPGFRHDVCSAVHPMALASPFLRSLPLAEHGLELLHPEVPLAHPLDGGRAAVLHRSLDQTTAELDGADGEAYRRLMAPLVEHWQQITADILAGPVWRIPRHPVETGRFGLVGLQSVTRLERRFGSDEAKALLAGCGAHAMRPLEGPATGAFALTLLMHGHSVGWPIAAGGSAAIAAAMASLLRSLGGEIETDCEVTSLRDVGDPRAVLFDISPSLVERICGRSLPERFRRRLRDFRHGPGVFKVDYALSEPVPWTAEPCRRAGTVHIGGTAAEIAIAERDVAAGRLAERPYVLVSQPSLADPSRAPSGKHTLWAYCHVPNGSAADMTAAIERQLERFAPGFGDVVLARSTMNAVEMAAHDASFVGGDINSGAADLRGVIQRPSLRWNPSTTPHRRILLCGASTPPGGGVHGMCGYNAAQAALRGVLA